MSSSSVGSCLSIKDLALALYKAECVKFGSFVLKSGITSPFYIDLRMLVSSPQLLVTVGELMWEKLSSSSFDVICGVPYTALPIATVISAYHNVPMVMRRREAKAHGTGNLIEGAYKTGDQCLIIEDLVTSSASILETAVPIEQLGMVVKDAVVLLDREQGGRQHLAANGIRLHSVLTVSELFDALEQDKLISHETVQLCKKFIAENQAPAPKTALHRPGAALATTLSATQASTGVVAGAPSTVLGPQLNRSKYSERALQCKNMIGKRLLQLMDSKKSNLCLSADVSTVAEVLALAEDLGPQIVVLKTHADALEDFTPDFPRELRKIADKHGFLIFEDRKFADIGSTVAAQYLGGVHRIAQWSDLVTVHSVPGPGVLKGLQYAVEKAGFVNPTNPTELTKGVLLLAQMSSQGNLADETYCQKTVAMAEQHQDLVVGFIGQSPLTHIPGFLTMTPGVSLAAKGDNLGQQYVTPFQAVLDRGADVIIVGRGIIAQDNPIEAASRYREDAWNAYEQRVSNI